MSLGRVRLGRASFKAYRKLLDKALYEEVTTLAKQLKGTRGLHINSTARGGGVAQLLQSMLPLYNDLGLKSDWLVTEASTDFYTITKKLHNGLQGAKEPISAREWKTYELQNQAFAAALKKDKWDYIFIHDPQPAAIKQFTTLTRPSWIWRCHIDLSHPNAQITNHFKQYIENYDASIFTLKSYQPKGLKHKYVAAIPPAIDAFSNTNRILRPEDSSTIVSGYGIDIKRPFICQVSRFDPWKDPIGVIKAWRLASAKIPGLQLVLMGDSAADDPEGQSVLETVMAEAKGEEDIFIVTDSSALAVNAFQTLASVVLQKSIREGFALTVSEALWANTPVIGGNVGGIPMQIRPGKNGYLVNNIEEAAKRIEQLIRNPLKARQMGKFGHEYVSKHFLLPRLLRDEMRLIKKLTQI